MIEELLNIVRAQERLHALIEPARALSNGLGNVLEVDAGLEPEVEMAKALLSQVLECVMAASLVLDAKMTNLTSKEEL